MDDYLQGSDCGTFDDKRGRAEYHTCISFDIAATVSQRGRVRRRYVEPAEYDTKVFYAVLTIYSVQTQGRNIRHYSTYLMYRAKSYQKAKTDYVRAGQGRMRKLTVDKGLLRETEAVQEQIAALIKCDVGKLPC